nr:DUF2066 domain-containing protein [Pseudomonadota bacterium]
MRLLLILLFLAVPAFLSPPAHGESADASIYQVTDVPADVTADSAVHARDQAIAAGQRTAFTQLLQRLGADPALAAKLTNDDVGTLVQSFEVQSEHTSRVRYIGTFTVRFRPGAVRSYLTSHNAFYTDAPSRPIVVLPIISTEGHTVLWEENTKWRAAWESGAHEGGLVPVVVPQGSLEDIALLSTEEAASGHKEAIRAMMDRYQAGGALVATLIGNLTKPGSAITVQLVRYDDQDNVFPLINLTLAAPADKAPVEPVLNDAVRQ